MVELLKDLPEDANGVAVIVHQLGLHDVLGVIYVGGKSYEVRFDPPSPNFPEGSVCIGYGHGNLESCAKEMGIGGRGFIMETILVIGYNTPKSERSKLNFMKGGQMTLIILLDNKVAYVEITLRCYCGCPWCYKCGEAHPKAAHVPFEVIVARIDWLVKYTDCNAIGLIGGEPVLHPQLKEICEYVLRLGKYLRITTSGKTSRREAQNLKYLLDLYREGLIAIDLSLQPGRNEKEYVNFVRLIKEAMVERRANLLKRGWTVEQDLRTMVSMEKSLVEDRTRVMKLLKLLLETSDYSLSSIDCDCTEMMETLGKNYLAFGDSGNWFYKYWKDPDDIQIRHTIDLMGLTLFDKNFDGSTHVIGAKGPVCGVGPAKIMEKQISLSPVLIRSDGEMMFVIPRCIPAKYGMCNVDLHQERDQIYEVVVKSLQRIGAIVYLANRKKAADNCGPDGKELPCTECPLDHMCDACYASERK
ncbi:MAG: Radical SAM domain protein [Candidatus Collierbacteria bacterium GW2011_GWC2_44_18]|uniref:Radical SAM domain protein n=1 Tax=Candidatus Collierbacteria bacterium GW2011_GWC2_44_18 TaxID=1618392 RepID=A0A0G1JYU2_9BACT|nr:MAG: Radical SAM domain protein [Microgenomates group bacterium GW2011_GWC1_44_10]KKT49072.1 MAG: Radical SAM domain protein [Candidatus Collierbacteria bacterium GW2011_GWC2_44_18]